MTASVTKPSFNPFASPLQNQALPATWHTLFADVFAAQSDYFQEAWFSDAGEVERLTDEANSKLKQTKAA